ncbi:acetylgalactosaminyl-O-glycosyl-glycoprotein beta-1,3-N-acetylglucosaminyltransferase-like isoform X2 [Heptranchias perlo]
MIVVGVGVLQFYSFKSKPFKNSLRYPKKVDKIPYAPKAIYRRQSVNLIDGKYTFSLNLTRYQEVYPYMQHYNCKFNTSEAKTCPSLKSGSLLIIATNSQPTSFYRRSALRRSWAQSQQLKDYMVITFFMVAMTRNEKLMALVAYESREYGDIILWDFEEQRANLTLKIRCLLQWLNDECTSADFVLKVDDDEFVNPEAVVNYINGDKNATTAISGNVHRHPMVYRIGSNKVSTYLHPSDIYPDFASGGGYLVPRAFIPELYRQSKRLPVFPVDDVDMGYLVLASKIPLRHQNQFHMWGLEYTVKKFKEAFVVHSLAPQQVIEMWNNLQKEKEEKKQ